MCVCVCVCVCFFAEEEFNHGTRWDAEPNRTITILTWVIPYPEAICLESRPVYCSVAAFTTVYESCPLVGFFHYFIVDAPPTQSQGRNHQLSAGVGLLLNLECQTLWLLKFQSDVKEILKKELEICNSFVAVVHLAIFLQVISVYLGCNNKYILAFKPPRWKLKRILTWGTWHGYIHENLRRLTKPNLPSPRPKMLISMFFPLEYLAFKPSKLLMT